MSDRRYTTGLWLGRIVAIIPPLILLICIGRYLVALKNAVLSSLPQIVASAAGESLNHEIRIGRISEAKSFSHIILENVAVSNGATFKQDNGRTALSAEQVDVYVDAAALAHDPTNAGAFISLVKVTRPHVFIERLPGNTFNFTSLFIHRKANPKAKAFRARIVAIDGTVVYRDDTAPFSFQRPAVNQANAVNGMVNFGAAQNIVFAAEASGAPNRVATIQVSGNVASATVGKSGATRVSGYMIRVAAQNADGVYWTHYFLNGITRSLADVTAGKADVLMTLSQTNPGRGQPLDISGSATVRGARFLVRKTQLVRAPVNDVNGRVDFTGQSIALTVSAKLGSMPLTVQGNVPQLRRPVVAFRVNAPSVDVSALHAALPFVPQLPEWLAMKSRASVTASATGPITQTQFDVAFTAPSADVYGVPVSQARGGLRYEGHSLTVDSLIASTQGRKDNIVLRGDFDLIKGGARELAGHVTGLNIAQITLPSGLRHVIGSLSGSVDADVAYASTGLTSADGLPIAVTGRLENGVLRGIPIREAAISLASDGRRVNIARLAAMQPNGALLSVSGGAPIAPGSGDPYALRLTLAGANVGELASAFGYHKVAGYAYFSGSVTGPLANPVLRGNASVFSGAYGRYQVDHMRAGISLSRRELAVSNGVARRLGLSVGFSGRVSDIGSAAPRITASASTNNAEIASVTEVVNDFVGSSGNPSAPTPVDLSSATGALSADLQVSGSLPDPRLAVDARVSSAMLSGLTVRSLDTTATFSSHVLHVTRLSGQVQGANVLAEGTLDTRTNAIRATVDVAAADLSRIGQAARLVAPVSGTATLTASVDGTLQKPRVLATASIVDGLFKGVQFKGDKVILLYDDGVITNPEGPVVIQSGPATYTISKLAYDSRSKSISALAQVSGERLARLVTIARNAGPESLAQATYRLPQGLDGLLTVSSVTADGPLSGPRIQVAASVADFTLGQANADPLSIRLGMTYDRGTILVDSLEARGRTEYVSASGSYVPHGPVTANIDASDIPLSYIEAFEPNVRGLSGDISDLTVVASGTAANPVVNASISLADVGAHGYAVDRVDSGRISLAGSRLSVDGLTFIKAERAPGVAPIQHVVTVRGSVPMTLSFEDGFAVTFPADQPISVTAELPKQSVSVLGLIDPGLAGQDLTGSVVANISIGGTLRAKAINGSVELSDATYQPSGLKTGFKNIDVGATFDGTHGTIKSSEIQSTAGGTIGLTGTVDVAQETTGRYPNAADALLGSLKLDLTATASNFTLNEPKIAALYNAGFQGSVTGELTATGSVLTPMIAGTANIARAVGILPTIAPNQSAPNAPPLFNPSLNVTVNVLQGGSLRSQQLDATADGKFQIARTLYQPDVTGDLYLRSGRFSFPTSIFRIVPTGVVHFVYNPPEETTERVDITATTSLTISNALLAANPVGINGVTSNEPYNYQAGQMSNYAVGGENGSQRYTITVTIAGDLSTPNGLHLDFESDPAGLTSQQILAALGGQQALNSLLMGGNVQEALQTEAQQIFTNYALPTLLEPVESNIASAFGLQEFDVNYEPESPLLISVLRQLTPRLDVRYTRYVNSRAGGAVTTTLTPLEYMVAVDYSFTPKLRLVLSTDDQHNNTIGIGGLFNF